MERLAVLLLLSFSLVSANAAYQHPRESELREHGHYTNRSGHKVHSPAHATNGGVPTGATAHCGDGTYSFSEHHSGTCSGHRGVAEWE
ncbi:DUF3761 domain-containing protein [Paraburkholderia sp. RP-4-7]|uniref:DUF3761 domain-containing protein n=1 Tax=Paraburkholderia polaris TaxID=2728848 RepID=A0A848IG30_9BURK|nr:DUF3761 domain-containing protein [Paraburkholderia polaris]NML99655.1 DUF3761 domain-containing protein [Paraburkholderia polaris]